MSPRSFIAGVICGVVVAIFAQGIAAPEYQAEIGQCRLSAVSDDTFQNTDMHTDNHTRSLCGGVALADKWSGSERFGWRLGLKAMGAIRVRDNVVVNDEFAHNHNAAPGCAPPHGEGCTLRFNGEGRTFGITASLSAEQPLTSRLKVVGEGGLFFFQHHFKAEARFINCAACGRQIVFNETSKLWDAPSPYAGLTLRWHGFYVAGRHYWESGHRALSVWKVGEMNELVLGWGFSR